MSEEKTPKEVYDETMLQLVRVRHDAIQPALAVYKEDLRLSNITRNEAELWDPVQADKDYKKNNRLVEKKYLIAIYPIELAIEAKQEQALDIYMKTLEADS